MLVARRGQVWRLCDETEETVDVEPGVSLVIPTGCSFQFRTVGPEPLRFVICTMPPWPGQSEAVAADGAWLSTFDSREAQP